MIPKRNIAFVRYKNRVNAEFAKVWCELFRYKLSRVR